jgi:hypothetical protein
VLITSIAITRFNEQKTIVIFFLISAVVPFALAIYWPYYPLWDLLTNQPKDSKFHLSSKILYHFPFMGILPSLIMPLILQGRDLIKPPAYLICFGILVIIYLYGFVTQQYGYGREISFITLMLHLVLAEWIVSATSNTKKLIIVSLVAVLSLPHLYFTAKTLYKNYSLFGKELYYDRYKILQKVLKPGDVVLTDSKTLCFATAFGAKVPATLMPPYWIVDNKKRLNDVDAFFLSADRRSEILKSYNVDYVMLTEKYIPEHKKLLESLNLPEESIVIRSSGLMLIRVRN